MSNFFFSSLILFPTSTVVLRLIFYQKSGIKILCLWKDFVMKESIRYWFMSTYLVDPWLITSMVLKTSTQVYFSLLHRYLYIWLCLFGETPMNIINESFYPFFFSRLSKDFLKLGEKVENCCWCSKRYNEFQNNNRVII